MRKLLPFCLSLGLIASACGLAATGEERKEEQPKSRDYTVRMVAGDKFEQKDIEVQVGDTVTWINASGAEHTATADNDSEVKFEEQVVAGGKFSKKVTFDKAGKVKYHCERHPTEMKGTITVKAAK